MNNFENINNNEQERKIEIYLDNEINNFVNINEKDIYDINEKVNNILGVEKTENDTVSYYSFSSREIFNNFVRENIDNDEKLIENGNAFFHINPETGEKIIVKYAQIPNEEELEDGRQRGFALEEVKEKKKLDILSAFAHETTHINSFFKKHGNDNTDNKWEQEAICSYVGEKIRGSFDERMVSKEEIDSFSLNDGNWDSKNKATILFYLFLDKEYGLDKVRNIWKELQNDSNIEKAIINILKQKPEEVVSKFKEKSKNKEYLKSIYT